MLISNKRKFIFVHIYKNAGSSMTNALMPYASNKWQRMTSHVLKRFNISLQFDPQPFPSHIKASELINAMGKEAFETFFSFAIIRNPWDWQVSLYKYMLKSFSHHQHALLKVSEALTHTSSSDTRKKSNFRKTLSIRKMVSCL